MAATVPAAARSGRTTAAAAADGAVVATAAAAGHAVGAVGQSFRRWTEEIPEVGVQNFGLGIDKVRPVSVLGRIGRQPDGACRQQQADYEPQWQQNPSALHDAHLRKILRAYL